MIYLWEIKGPGIDGHVSSMDQVPLTFEEGIDKTIKAQICILILSYTAE